MTLARPHLLKLIAPVAAFALLLLALTVSNRSSAPPSVAPGVDVTAAAGASTAQQIESLQRVVRADPGSADAYAQLGDAYLQRWRESGDPGFYTRAGAAFDAALRRDARSVGAVIGAGTLANLQHDFAEGLRRGVEAHRLAPELVRPWGVIADAQIELGRYAGARRSIQRMVDAKPSLSSYARVSYYRELTGDLTGAVAAMRLAVSAGGDADSTAYVRTLLGDLELQRGRVRAASDAYRTALAARSSYPQALVGLARVEIVGGERARAAARLHAVAARLPLTTTLTLLVETEHAIGDRSGARRDLAVAHAQRRLLAVAGAIPDAEAVLFEANHGDPGRAMRLGRRVWAAAPSVRSADALGWALFRAGRAREALPWTARALRLGSRDPQFRLHAGLIERAAGRGTAAARDLRLAERGAAALSPGAISQLKGSR
jgi:tetratricopeptide (TPR) repeat protein